MSDLRNGIAYGVLLPGGNRDNLVELFYSGVSFNAPDISDNGYRRNQKLIEDFGENFYEPTSPDDSRVLSENLVDYLMSKRDSKDIGLVEFGQNEDGKYMLVVNSTVSQTNHWRGVVPIKPLSEKEVEELDAQLKEFIDKYKIRADDTFGYYSWALDCV